MPNLETSQVGRSNSPSWRFFDRQREISENHGKTAPAAEGPRMTLPDFRAHSVHGHFQERDQFGNPLEFQR